MYLPGSRIGIVGGGQLGRMLALEARRMGYGTLVLDPDPNGPAAQVADAHIAAPLADPDAARELAERADVVTLEWENADAEVLSAIEGVAPLRPGPRVLAVAQNRILEKTEARRLGLATAEFRPVQSREAMAQAIAEIGTPAILKTATGGYDGRGQQLIRTPNAAMTAFDELGGGTTALILEQVVDFTMEASVICARSVDDQVRAFPVVRNIHHNGILDFTLAPAGLPDGVIRAAVEIGETLIRGLDVVGLLAIELFVDRDGRVLVNEIAPRPHNSGHYTWEACSVSQFEQQLRAVCGLPLADPVLLKPAAMANLLGEHIGTGRGLATLADALAEPMVAFHLYGKDEGRPGRKMGHLTALADSADEAHARVRAIRGHIQAGFKSAKAAATDAENHVGG